MAEEATFRVNSPGVAWEDFQDEVIIVNLESGAYFSTREVGAEIWRRVADGMPLAALESALAASYDVDAVVLSEALTGFVATLREEGLLVPAPTAASSTGHPAPAPATKLAFVAPKLDAYSDMQDLLLLDPIHEVDESGWPNPK